MATADDLPMLEELMQRVFSSHGPFDVVLAYLEPRGLLNLTVCQKQFYNQLRYRHVFQSSFNAKRSGSYSPGFPSDDLNYHVEITAKRAIWVPTPLRLLRLANAQFGRRKTRLGLERVWIVHVSIQWSVS